MQVEKLVDLFKHFRWDDRRFYCFYLFNSVQDGRTAFDLSMCYGKDFKSYDLAKLLRQVPATRAF